MIRRFKVKIDNLSIIMKLTSALSSFTIGWLIAALSIVCLFSPSAPEPVNVALNKPVTAYYSCGHFGREVFTTMTDAYNSASTRPRRSCQDIITSPTGYSYPPEAMVDGRLETWWQSSSRTRNYYYGIVLASEMSRELEAIIDIDLNQEFLIDQIIIQLGDALSPQKISILKSLDNKTFTEWITAVTINDMCSTFFSTSYKTSPENVADIICINYAADDKPPGDTITFDLGTVPASLKEWTRVRYLRIKLYDMMFVYPFNSLADSYNHYTVTELTAKAECPCNGMQTGCTISNITGMYECICGGNTQGRFCETCLPLFNQFAFQYGKPCVECYCFGHSTSCFYKTSVEEEKLSLDKTGARNGGGVCLDCKNNTAGINCEKCVDLHYRPIDRLQTDENACIPCQCDSSGSTVNPDTNLVDCLMNNDTTRPNGKLPGDCYCKANVMGSKCDICKPEFYNLQQSNPLGCSSCDCYTTGTVNGATICTPDYIGQCTCKTNVEGRACDKCKDGFYNLTRDNPLGCSPCNCDVGGSVDQNCDKNTGQCLCVSQNLQGKSCDSIQQGFYYPSPHSIVTELEDSVGEVVVNRNPLYTGFSGRGYAVVGPGKTLTFVLTTPRNTDLSNDYVSLIVYRSQSICNMTVQVETTDDVINKTLILPPCPNSWCQMIGSISDVIFFIPGPNLISIRINSGLAFLDKFIALPIELTNVTQLLSSPLPVDCDIVRNLLPSDPVNKTACQKAIFTITMYYWNSPLACNCDLTGSVSTYCNVTGGQCQCQPGVTGRTCSKCKPDHYAFTSTGCTACYCTGSSSSCDSVTGQCQCPDNTIGRQCEFCMPNNWNWSKSDGCQDCGCYSAGSSSLQCNLTTGVCQCRAGFEGIKCDSCGNEYYLTSNQECSPCLCDQAGSSSPVCNKTSGQCPCKNNTTGQQCTTCTEGSFGLGTSISQGCLECVCMGITKDCTSAGVKLSYSLYNLMNKSENTPMLQLVDENVIAYNLSDRTNPNQIGAVVVDVALGQPQLYWKLPDTFISSLLSLYGSDVNFTVLSINISDSTKLALNAILMDARGNKLAYPLGAVEIGKDTSLHVPLKEDGWKRMNDSVAATRGEFLKTLSMTKALLIPASFVTGKHTAQLSQLLLSSESDVGPVNPAVEQCQCGPGYKGRSCQMCAPGYKRINATNPVYFGNCVPCECNGHSTLCDPDTGICQDCQNNTAGSSCDVCKTGYYGDPQYVCTQCPCYPPRVTNETCHFVNSSDGLSSIPVCSFCKPGYVGNLCDSCDANYFGEPMKENGSCQLCECNGNSDHCDNITGICSSCSSNTTGNKCEICLEGFFGNASLHNCQECNCRASNSSICNSTTGQCSCLPGIEGRDCSYCIVGHWGFIITSGCMPCQCVDQGSVSTQCNGITGLCSCKPNTVGASCDTCVDGFYGLPLAPCQACNCSSIGSIPSTICNKTTGQCQCQPGVGGLNCDQCLPLYVNFSSSGCQECGQCQRSLGEDINSLIQTGQSILNRTKSLLEVQREGLRLDSLSFKLNESLNLLGLANSNATSIQDVVSEVDGIKRNLETTFQMTKSNISQLSIAVQQTKINSDSVLSTFSSMKDVSTNLSTLASAFEDKLNTHLLYLRQFKLTASQYLNRNSSTGSILSFVSESETATTLFNMVNNSIRVMTETNLLINQQSASIDRLNNTAVNLNSQLDSNNLAQDNLTSVLDSLSSTTFNVNNIQAQTEIYRSQAEILYQSTNDILNSTLKTNEEILSSLTTARWAVRYTDAIYSGNASIVMSGPDYPPFPIGVTNYQTGVSSLEALLSTTPEIINLVSSNISNSESHVAALNESMVAINSSYQNISVVGKEAVKAIANLQTVIRDLETSVGMVSSAQQLIVDVENNLTGAALDLMKSTYEGEKNISETSRNRMLDLALAYQPQVLKSNLDSAFSWLDKEGAQWVQADSAINTMTLSADILSTQLKDKRLTDDLASALARIQAAAATAQSASVSVKQRDSDLNQKQSEIELLQSQIKRAQDLQLSVSQSLSVQQVKTADFKNNMMTASSLVNSMDQPIKSVEDKIKLLESKMAHAESLLSRLRKPLTFDGTLSLQVKNSLSGSAHLYDDVLIDVKKPGNFSEGVILFMDSPGTESEFQLGVSQDKMFFKFNTGNQTVSVTSRAEICADCWVRVYVTRYANVGHLTVTPLPSGIPVSDSNVGPESSGKTLSLSSNIYIGTLSSDKLTNKVINREFRGCLFNAKYQGEFLNLWTKAASATTQVKCCDVPPSPSSLTSTTGISFTGFGSIELSPGSIIFSDFTQLSFEMRTFSADATLFSVSSTDMVTSFTLSLNSGYVQWTIVTNGNSSILKSNNQYNDGSWAQILATKNNTVMQLVLRRLTDQNSLDVINLSAATLDLSSLYGRNFLLGSSTITFIGNEKLGFAGCMRAVLLSTSQAATQLPFNQPTSSNGVSTAGCYANIIKGITLMSKSAYAQLSTTGQLQQLKKLELDITTQEPNGIFLYISSDSALRFFYLALYGGNVIVVYRQNDTVTVVGSGHYLSDSQTHNIKIDCSTYRVSVKIDGVPLEDTPQTLATDYLSFPSNAMLYVGGKPSLAAQAEFPVVYSIVGGISRLVLNDGTLSLMDSLNHSDVSYAGIPVAVVTQASTQQLLASTTASNCAARTIPSYLSPTAGFVMTGQYDINLSTHVQLTSLMEYLEATFAIDLDVALYKADGVLLYVADLIKTPESYFTIFVMDGLVHLQMRTSTKTNLQAVLSKRINDGHRITISLLRINDFVAIKNDLDKDYQNTQMNPNITSQFLISNTNNIYLGGLGVYDIQSSPLPESFRTQPEKVKFAGAVYSVKVSKTPSESVLLKIDTLDRTQFPAISSNVVYGMSLSGASSYLGLGPVSTLSSFTVNITLSARSSGLIFLFYVTSSSYFIALDFNDNQMKLNLAPSFRGISETLALTLDASSQLCDGKAHILSLKLDSSVALSVDDVVKSTISIPASHSVQPMTNADFYIAGLKDSSLSLPDGLSKASISGCVQSVALDAMGSIVHFDPTQYTTTSFGTSYSCT